MERLIIFLTLSILIIIISWRTLFTIRSHGLYRFFSWECIAWLFASNYIYWFEDPFSVFKIISWIFLIISGYMVIAGVIQLREKGKPKRDRDEKTLYLIEQTTELVDQGIYKYIRHPLYSSLLFLSWGILFKNVTFTLILVAIISTISLYLTAFFEERECINFFGDRYVDYMKKTKRFIPYIT